MREELRRLKERLYPTGRAWRFSGFRKNLHLGLMESELRLFDFTLNILNQIRPDNPYFTTDDADIWERRLRLPNGTGLDLEIRKSALLRKLSYPGSKIARQDILFIETQLRLAGFDVYAFENKFDDGSGNFIIKRARVGAADGTDYDIDSSFGIDSPYGNETELDVTGFIANQIRQSHESIGELSDINFRSTFFIGGLDFGSPANIDAARELEFRNLVLILKPLHTFAYLFINYT